MCEVGLLESIFYFVGISSREMAIGLNKKFPSTLSFSNCYGNVRSGDKFSWRCIFRGCMASTCCQKTIISYIVCHSMSVLGTGIVVRYSGVASGTSYLLN
jgi:hypothetical protein